MKEWRQTITAICTVVLASAALAALMQFELAAIRAEMSSEHAQMREEMSREHAQMRGEHAQMRGEHAQIREEMSREHAAIRTQLNSIDRRTARIEGHLFGIEIVPDPADGPDNQWLELGGIIAATDARPARDTFNSGVCERIVPGEIDTPLRYGYLSEATEIEDLNTRSVRTSAILTGHDAKPPLCEYVGLVIEMRTFQHPFDSGIEAVRGIGF